MVVVIKRPEFSKFEHDLYEEWTKGTAAPLTFKSFNNKTTICVLKLSNGFEVVGTSGCEDPHKFDALIGDIYALKDALRKLGELAAFYRAQKAYDIKHAKPLVAKELSPFEIEELRRLMEREKMKLGTSATIIETPHTYDRSNLVVTTDKGYMTSVHNKLDAVGDVAEDAVTREARRPLPPRGGLL